MSPKNIFINLKGKKALVTGASRGLGLAIAGALANEGAEVAAVSRSGSSVGSFQFRLDLMEPGAAVRLVNELGEKFGFPEIIVHNLGGTLEIKNPLASVKDWEKVWRFNLGIAIELNNLLIPKMQKKRSGRIVHISSLAAVQGCASIPYCSAKAALNAYVKGIAPAFSKDGIIISAVSPGPILAGSGQAERIAAEVLFLTE